MIFRFGRYELDEEAGELRRDGRAVAIQPKPFALLRHLIRERDRVVEQDELFELLWPGVAVTPSSLTRAVSVARSAIGDTGRGDVVKSVARRGYRFAADVLVVDDEASPPERSRGDGAGREVFVGRDDALGRLREAWTEAATGRGGLVLVTGPPGIGKTRLTEVFGAEALAAGARLLVGRARDGEGVPPLWLWAQVVRKLDAAALPDLALELAGDGAETRDESASPSPAQSRFLLFDGVTRALAAASRARPLVIVLEDLQWAGSASLRLLEHASFEIGDASVLVIATVRDEARARAHPVERTLATLRAQPRTSEIALRAFSRREVALLLERALGRPAPPDLSSELVARTEGVPLLLREALRLLRERGDLRQPEGVRRWAVSLPAQALDLIRRPLERLSPACADLLAAGAVLGREWPLAIAAAVSGTTRDAALDLVDEAEAAGILERAADSAPATWRFSHALYQEAVHAALPAGRRARLHARAVDELERRHGVAAEHVIAELAHHHHEALAVGDPKRAFAAAAAAAARAARVCAFEQMAVHHAQALDALDHAEPVDAVRRLETLLALGEALRLSGDRARRRSVFEQAMAAARALERPADFARAAIGFCDLSEWAPRDGEARAALEEALARLGSESGVERARVLTRIAYLGARGRPDPESEDVALLAIEEARRSGDPHALQEALYARHFLIGSPHRLEERAGLEAELVAAARRSALRDTAVIALVDSASDRLALGDAQGARRARADAEALAGPNPHLGMLWHLRSYDAGLAQMEGRTRDAERLADEALALGTRIEHPFAHGVRVAQAVEIARDQERFDAVVAAIDLGATTPWLEAIAGRALLAAGREPEARAVLDALAERGFDSIRRNVRWAKTLIEIAGLCCDLGDAARAAALRDLLAPFDRLHGVLPVPVCYGGPVAHALARLTDLLGDADAAAGLYEDALAGAEALGARPAQARILADHASLLARRGDRRGARPLAERARAIATELAMSALAARAGAIASR